jgi:hypothetical protein
MPKGSFDSSKHPRGAGGRFGLKAKLSKADVFKQSVKVSATTKKAKADAELQKARLAIYKDLSLEQRARLKKVLTEKRIQSTLAETILKAEPPKVYAKDYLAASRSSVSINKDKLEIWSGKPDFAKAKGGFNSRKIKDFEYAVQLNGERVVLNRNVNMHTFMGERVYGVPSLNHKLAELTTAQLSDRLAKYMTKVELNDGSVPDWLPSIHGKIDPKYLGNAKEYKRMQIHHIDQWAAKPLDDIVKRHQAGDITLDEAKAETRALMVSETVSNKKGNSSTDWRINPAPQSDRKLVVLADVLHDVRNVDLYFASHPAGIDLDSPTFKLRRYGIMKGGDSGRDWFDGTFRPQFWVEAYRRESYILSGEINRRIKKGEITAPDAKKLYEVGLEKVDKSNQYRLSLENKSTK